MAALRQHEDKERSKVSQRFFKTGPGEYAEGDLFLGVTVPITRGLVRQFAAMPHAEVLALLASPIHEARLMALLLLVRQFERGKDERRAQIVEDYLGNTRHINNWDLVDSSAPQILGEWLVQRDRSVLDRLARSPDLWERRIAILATFAFIRQGQCDDTFRITEALLGDPHDLIHKATGWMLREVAKRDHPAAEAFLRRHLARLPRTTLRYAIEKFPEALRQRYLIGHVG